MQASVCLLGIHLNVHDNQKNSGHQETQLAFKSFHETLKCTKSQRITGMLGKGQNFNGISCSVACLFHS